MIRFLQDQGDQTNGGRAILKKSLGVNRTIGWRVQDPDVGSYFEANSRFNQWIHDGILLGPIILILHVTTLTSTNSISMGPGAKLCRVWFCGLSERRRDKQGEDKRRVCVDP